MSPLRVWEKRRRLTKIYTIYRVNELNGLFNVKVSEAFLRCIDGIGDTETMFEVISTPVMLTQRSGTNLLHCFFCLRSVKK
jgi:hypothetical protein